MSDVPERPLRPPRPWRWLIWTTYVLGWSAALLTTKPAQLAVATLPGPTIRLITAKTLHVVCYALLTVLTGWLRLPRRLGWLFLLLLSLHACATEYGQRFVPLRGSSVLDVGWDHLGIALGLALGWKLWRSTLFGPDQAG